MQSFDRSNSKFYMNLLFVERNSYTMKKIASIYWVHVWVKKLSTLQGELITYLGLDKLSVDISDLLSVEWKQKSNNILH